MLAFIGCLQEEKMEGCMKVNGSGRMYEGERKWKYENILNQANKFILVAARSKGVSLQPLAY